MIAGATGGIVLGLLTRGMEPFLAAAAVFGPCLLAADLPDLLRKQRRMPCRQWF